MVELPIDLQTTQDSITPKSVSTHLASMVIIAGKNFSFFTQLWI